MVVTYSDIINFSSAVRDIINYTYHEQWIDRAGPTAWPPRSPDLNPLDFYLWGHLNAIFHAAPVDNEEALHHRIENAYQTIQQLPSVFERMRRSRMRYVEMCIEFHGGNLEHLL
jgi:hypothetical protein